MSMKKKALMAASYVMVAALAVGGTVAFLTDEERDINVMTLGNVDIEQLEYERAVDENGVFETITTAKGEGYKLQEFTQNKPLYPSFAQADAVYDTTQVNLDQLDTGRGAMDVFENKLAQDKFVFVKNTGKSSAYVRTIIAFELGEVAADDWSSVIMTSKHLTWTANDVGAVTINGNNYYLVEYIYDGADGVQHDGGVLPAGDITYNSLAQVYMTAAATNEDVEALDGNGNGTYDILVVSQAVQSEGFADAEAALDAGFGDITTTDHPWAEDDVITVSTADDFKAVIKKGGNVVVNAAMDLTADPITGNVVKKDTVINFQDNELSYTADYVDGMNGTQIAALTLENDADLTVLNGNINATSSYGIYAKNGNLHINSGTFTAGTSVIQVKEGIVNISGGTFKCTSDDKRYLLNCIDADYKNGNAKIIVSGGTFIGFDPSNNASEGEGTNYVAEGFKVIEEEQANGEIWYTVVAD